jgi:hypothetical protein
MNIEKNYIIIFLIIICILTCYRTNKNESFTPKEMKSYPKMLNENCKNMSNVYKRLQKMNKIRCDPSNKAKTQRDNINTRQVCYDDIGKEIVAKYDTESNCILSKLIKKPESISYVIPISKSTSSASINSPSIIDLTTNKSVFNIPSVLIPSVLIPSKTSKQSQLSKQSKLSKQSPKLNSIDLEEGPNFINKSFLNTYNIKNSSYSNISFDKEIGSGKYSDVNFISDINFSSDPALLYRMSKS